MSGAGQLPVRMVREKDSAEIVARVDYATGWAFVTVVCWPAMARHLTRRYGRSLDAGLHLAGGPLLTVARWRVPAKAVSFRALKLSDVAPEGAALAQECRERASLEG